MPPIVFPVADADIILAYLAAFAHIFGWGYLTQPGRRELDVADEVGRLLDLPDDELITFLLNPASFRRWRATLVQALYDGEVGPYQERASGGLDHLVVGPLHCPRPLWTTVYDVVIGRLLGVRAPRVLRAVREIPTGKAYDRKPRRVRPDLTIGSIDDPPVVLGGYRQRVKTRCEKPLADGLHPVLNSMFYGLLGQEDGRLYDPVLAATIPAVVRMWLAIAEYMIRRRGGMVANRDTDGFAVPCSPDGGSLRLPDETEVRVLS
jgi:hypothetical protein